MAASLADIRDKLKKYTIYELQSLAKSLKVTGYTKLKKEELERQGQRALLDNFGNWGGLAPGLDSR